MDDHEQIFDEAGFVPAFLTDVSNARGLVLIKSTYLAATRIAKMLPTFQRCINRGVHFEVFAQDPTGKFNNDEARQKIAITQAAASMLTAEGIRLHYLSRIHEKLAIIDDMILWSGCLNILSYNDTHEEMTRYYSRVRVSEAIVRHKLDKHASRGGRLPDWAAAQDRDDGEVQKSFGAYVISRRQELNLSQRQLASLADVGPSTLCQIETGAIDGRHSTIARICRALGCAVLPVPRFLVPTVASTLHPKKLDETESGSFVKAKQ